MRWNSDKIFPGREAGCFYCILSREKDQVTFSRHQDVHVSVHGDGVLSRRAAGVNLHCDKGKARFLKQIIEDLNRRIQLVPKVLSMSSSDLRLTKDTCYPSPAPRTRGSRGVWTQTPGRGAWTTRSSAWCSPRPSIQTMSRQCHSEMYSTTREHEYQYVKLANACELQMRHSGNVVFFNKYVKFIGKNSTIFIVSCIPILGLVLKSD